MSKTNGHKREDYIADGFHVVDEKYISKRPPKIRWGNKYKAWSDKEKIKYLEEFACSYNHAVALIQDERDELNRLIMLKEDQLTRMSKAMTQNNAMLQSEITQMNLERQGFNNTVKKLDAEIKELKNGDNT